MGLFGGPDVEVKTSKTDASCAVKATETDTVKIKGPTGREIKIEETLTVCASKDGAVQSVEYTGKVAGGALQNLGAYGSGDGITAGMKTSVKLSNADGSLTKEALRDALAGHGDLIKEMGKKGVRHHVDKSDGGHETTFLSDLAKAPKVAKTEAVGR